MLWVTLLATVAVALAEVEIITSPTPGNEYVHISGSPQDAKNSTDASRISVKDEGLSGIQHKHYQNKKVEHHPVKKENLGVKATVKDEGLSGVVKKQSGIGVPPLKHMDEPKYDVIGHHKSHKWDGGIDFDDDLPLSDKKLKPAGTSQSSRVNVKKGPNGQEYEYEYVYYYYDDEGDETTVAPAHAPAPTVRGQYSEVDRPTSSRRPSSEVSEEPRIRGELVKQKNVESGQEPPRSRGDSIDHRGGHRVVEVTEIDEEELHRRRTESRNDDRSKNRYTTIERGSGSSGGRGRGDAVAVTTAEPSVNEVLPSRGAQRSRGRQVETAVIEDDRLPANTRFPSRGRSSSVATTIPPQPSAPAQTQTSRSRTQGSGPTIRRPSLVDSSSFRTHASDPAPAADFDRNYYRSSPVLDNTRESDLEEYVQPELVRPTTFVPAQTTLPPSPLPLPDQREQSMPDKAALDLYAILQQQQEENSVSGLGGDAYLPTELITTPEPTTVTTTTTTTTTTPAPTTTTTTTTTTTPPPPPVGRGRFRGAAPGSRTRLRPGASTTTTTTEAPQEEEAPRRKFSPSNSGRSPGQVSAYGRRGAGARASTTTSAPEQEASTARTRASFGGNRNSYRARGRTTPAPSNQDEEAAPETSASTTTSRPTRPRLNVSAATRPLRPGPRINLRGRPGISTTAATPAAAPEEEEPASPSSTSPPPPPAEEEASPSPAAPTDALSRLRNRPRLKVTPRQPGAAAPTAAAPRPPPVGFRRPGRPLSQQQTSAAPEEPAPAPTEPAPPPTEAAVDAAPTEPPPQSPLPPHLARRRPAIRRLQIPHHPQQ